jgi:hypothetical protein
MTLQPAAEASAVDKPAKAAQPAARKRTTAARTTTPRPRKTAPKPTPVEVVEIVEIVEPSPALPPVAAVKKTRHSLRAIAGFGVVLAAAVAALLLFGQRDETAGQNSAKPAAVSAEQLASFADSLGAPVDWAGPRQARTLELTQTSAGTFVRYLPAGTAVGASSRALTVATYPLLNAYGTAVRRAKGAGMTSSLTGNGGLAVWSTAQPTSVYVAFRGVPSLVEVYAPQAKEARTLALSGQLRPVG